MNILSTILKLHYVLGATRLRYNFRNTLFHTEGKGIFKAHFKSPLYDRTGTLSNNNKTPYEQERTDFKQ